MRSNHFSSPLFTFPKKRNTGILSNWSRLLKIITLTYTYQLAKFGDPMSCGSKDIFKNAPVSSNNTIHDVTDLVNHGMVKNKKK